MVVDTTPQKNGKEIKYGPNGKRIGRPINSRNKASITKAQLVFDDEAENAANVLLELMNDPEVAPTVRLNAAKEILAKSIANQKDKVEDEDAKALAQKELALVPSGPKIFSSAN